MVPFFHCAPIILMTPRYRGEAKRFGGSGPGPTPIEKHDGSGFTRYSYTPRSNEGWARPDRTYVSPAIREAESG